MAGSMKKIPSTRDKAKIVGLGHEWVALMASERYVDAYQFTSHDQNGWTAETMGEVVKAYGEQDPDQKITVEAASTDVRQRIEVDFYDEANGNRVGSLWYDLGINGFTSDLTATFTILDDGLSLWLQLDDIHVM